MEDNKLRSVSTWFWDDPYIQDLVPDQKLLFLFFITNRFKKLSGIYEISLKNISAGTGFSEDVILSSIKKFSDDKKIFYFDKYIILANNSKHNKFNHSMLTNVKKQLNSLPINIINYIHSLNIDRLNKLMLDAGFNNFFVSKYDSFQESANLHSSAEGKFKIVVEIPHKPCFFDDSPFKNKDVFKIYFSVDDFIKYDPEYYYNVVSKWSSSKNKKSKNWIATAQNFAVKDEKEGHPVYSADMSTYVINVVVNNFDKVSEYFFKNIQMFKYGSSEIVNAAELSNAIYDKFLKNYKDIEKFVSTDKTNKYIVMNIIEDLTDKFLNKNNN